MKKEVKTKGRERKKEMRFLDNDDTRLAITKQVFHMLLNVIILAFYP